MPPGPIQTASLFETALVLGSVTISVKHIQHFSAVLVVFDESEWSLHLFCLLVLTPKPLQPRLKRPINLFRQLSTRPWLHAADVDLLTVCISRLSATAVPPLGDLG